MARERLEPSLLLGGLDEFDQRPHQSRRLPRVPIGGDAACERERFSNERAREWEVDICANAVTNANVITNPRPAPEPRREPLCEPTLDPTCGHGDDLGGERVRRNVGEQAGERLRQHVCPFRSMDH